MLEYVAEPALEHRTQEDPLNLRSQGLMDLSGCCRILEQLASSPQPRYWVSGHDDECATRYARPAKPEGMTADMETHMAEEFPPLPSQLFGSPPPNALPYLSTAKASQQGAYSSHAAVISAGSLHACWCLCMVLSPT